MRIYTINRTDPNFEEALEKVQWYCRGGELIFTNHTASISVNSIYIILLQSSQSTLSTFEL